MNSKNIYCLLVTLIFTSCYTGKKTADQSPVPQDETFYARYLFNDSGGITYYECEDFVTMALEEYSTSYLDKTFSKVLVRKKEPVRNPQDILTIDTIYTYANAGNKIQIYRTKQEDFVFTFDVTDPRLGLKYNVKPGMHKTDFNNKFHITDSTSSHILIRNTEATIKLLFYFNDSILKRINSYIYLD